jgi:hypothetical protein
MIVEPGFNWRMFGEDGQHCLTGVTAYDYDKHHSRLAEAVNFNPILFLGATPVVLGLHYGDLDAIRMAVDNLVETVTRALQEPERQSTWPAQVTMLTSISWPHIFGYSNEFGSSFREAIGSTWSEIEVCVDETAKEVVWFAPRGQQPLTGSYAASMDTICCIAKCNSALCFGEPTVSKQQMQAFPSPHELSQFARADKTVYTDGKPCSPMHLMTCPHLVAAMASEQYGLDDQALGYVDVIHNVDVQLGGDWRPSSHILAHLIKGRVMARRDQMRTASAAFEAAFAQAEQLELWLLAAFALRDLKVCILDGMGHGMHGSRRLGVVLRRLKGPSERLSELLSGLDVGEIVSLAPPEAGVQVAIDYKDKDEDTQATLPQRTGTKVAGVAAAAAADLERSLRQELQGLRLTALQKRAASEGVEQEVIEDATDSDQPKDNLIALVIQHVAASNAERDQAAEEETAAALEALRQDLEGMRLTALQRRAASEGVEETQIDNAMDGEDPKAGIVALILQHQ